jgi:DNA polymerase III subunit delta'
MNWNDLRGHTDQIAMLRRSISRNRLAHAYLYAGPSGVGKFRFARIVAQCLLCERHADDELMACDECSPCKQVNAGSHPDLFVIGCPEGKNEIHVDVFKGEKDKRNEGLIHDLSLRPMAGNRRIAILDDANQMNDTGANVMLKTIEEPPDNSLLILIADNLEAILPTIRSRCQLLRFSALPTDDVAELLLENEVATDPNEAAVAAAMSDGSLRTASQLLNPALRNLRSKLYEALASPKMNPLDVAKTIVEVIDEISSDTPEQRQNMGWLIRFAQEFYRQAALSMSGDTSMTACAEEVATYCSQSSRQGTQEIELAMEQFDRTVLAESHIDWNINPARSIEALLDDLARIQRRPVAKV